MRELFVWYRVPAGRADAARTAVTAMQRSLQSRYAGLVARLLVRHEVASDEATWMETYARPAAAGGIDTDTEAAIEAAAASALAPLIDGVRHAEAFVAVAAQSGRSIST